MLLLVAKALRRKEKLFLGKRFITVNGTDFYNMVMAGAANLRSNVDRVNALNVFPVPDGDTGTNMNLTMTSGVEELKKRQNPHIGKAAEALSKGLLMGARGNSGVILSQVFRGFAKAVQSFEEVGVQQFAQALQQGVDTAYAAVVKPVEGTILTVSKEAAKHGGQVIRRVQDVRELVAEVVQAGNQSLARTPELLPVLKQVGVVDAGGQGLMLIYEGFLAALNGSAAVETAQESIELHAVPNVSLQEMKKIAHESRSAQSMLRTEDIEFGYCTEFIINLVPGKVKGFVFDETKFRQELSKHGDSLLVVADDELVKIHIHAEYPGSVMNYAMNYGDLTKIKIENMRDQHTHILLSDEFDVSVAVPKVIHAEEAPDHWAPYGFVAVTMGEGISEIFESLGVDVILSGGQTMNPSTEDIVNAVRDVPAKTVFVFPNNSNIVLAANQAVELVEDKSVIVIPSKTVPQGMAAMLAFDEKLEADANTSTMLGAMKNVRSGQVTFAVRDTSIDGVDIKEGDFIGLEENKIVTSNPSLLDTCRSLLDSMLEKDGEIVTILTGEDARQEDTDAITAYLGERYPQAEVEIHAGGQPLYAYIFSVE